MNPIQRRRILLGNIGTQYDNDALALIRSAKITDPKIKAAINNLFKDFKGIGANNTTYEYYSKLPAFWLFVGGSASSCMYNAKNASDSNQYNLNFVGGWTHSANGSKANGTNAYADTFYAQNLLNQNTNGMSVYYIENTLRSEIQMGHQSRPSFTVTAIAFDATGKWSGADKYSGAGGTTVYGSKNGLVRLNRGSSSNYKVYKNGSQIESLSAPSEANTDTTTILIGAQRRGDNNTAQAYSDKTYCYADIMPANSLSDAEEAVYYNIIQAFQTAMGRQV
jgi:hypothetical protein